MRIYIWEGDRISDAYHDDGTLVVLAETPEQARELVRAKRQAVRDDSDVWDGDDAALDREPDRIVELDRPTWVAFNGGGYD